MDVFHPEIEAEHCQQGFFCGEDGTLDVLDFLSSGKQRGVPLACSCAHLALGSDVGHVFVAELRYKHAGDIAQFPAALFCFCCKKYAGCSNFLQEHVCGDAKTNMMEGAGPV